MTKTEFASTLDISKDNKWMLENLHVNSKPQKVMLVRDGEILCMGYSKADVYEDTKPQAGDKLYKVVLDIVEA